MHTFVSLIIMNFMSFVSIISLTFLLVICFLLFEDHCRDEESVQGRYHLHQA